MVRTSQSRNVGMDPGNVRDLSPWTIQIVAGEPSGDQLAAELVQALRRVSGDRPVRFFGAGGPKMGEAGVELAFDLTQHAIIGIPSISEYLKFRGFRDTLSRLALERSPDVFIGVDYFGFNGRLAERIRQSSPLRNGPKMVQFVSPQVWASRPGRARRMVHSHDLLLSILPFEKQWYRTHAPGIPVEFVGHPMVDRHSKEGSPGGNEPEVRVRPGDPTAGVPLKIVLLPGSRPGEIRRHGSVLLDAAKRIQQRMSVSVVWVAPTPELAKLARPLLAIHPEVILQIGGLREALKGATLALASTGTVTLECAWFGVPFVALYKTSWLTYEIGKRIITVKHLAMPNLLAGRTIAPEFVQNAASASAISAAGLELLENPEKWDAVRSNLASVVQSLGPPGAVDRAATAILNLLARHAPRFPESPLQTF